MPDTPLSTTYDLRTPAGRADFYAEFKVYVKDRKSSPFACRDVADALGCTMAQARMGLNRYIAEGRLDYSGNTRNTRYFKPKRATKAA